ncbi:MAG: quinonprotein alcohol dehydrogenase, partial [Planctomycetota bacterium]
MLTFRTAIVVVASFAFLLPLSAEDWPQFRGPTACGLSRETDLPLTWGGPKDENVIWSAALPGSGLSSPITWKDRIVVMGTSRKDEGEKAGSK